MGGAIGQILPFAIGVALSPIPIVAVVLMLVSRRAKVNGPMFVLGWFVGLAIIGVIALNVAGPSGASDSGQPAAWVNWLEILLGALLLVVATKQWRTRPDDGVDPPPPKWMAAIADFTPVKAAGAGAVLGAVNPKNLLLAIGAAATIAATGISGSSQAVAYAVFAVIATAGVAAPVVLYVALGDRSKSKLDSLKVWMIHNNATIMAVLSLVIGAKLIGDAITGFAA